MTWDDFAPFVLPYAPGCPDATAEHHLRQAAISFCRHTNVWQTTLAALTGDGVLTSFAMVLPTDAEASKLLGVAVTESGLAISDASLPVPSDGAQRIRDGSLHLIAFTEDLRTLTVWPAQPVAASIVATAALKPSMTAATFPAVLFGHYAQDIANGALATILSMPKTEWTDMNAAAIKAAEFNARKATVARIVERGFSKSTRRSSTRWF